MSATAALPPAIASWQAAFAAQPASAARNAAFEAFLQQGLPTARNDAWKYTDLRRLAARTFQLPQTGDLAAAASLLLQQPTWHRITWIDGEWSESFSGALPNGVTLSPEDYAPTSASFDLLNAALNRETYVVDIAANTKIEEPIYIAHLWSDSANGWMRHPRIVLRVGAGAHVRIVEHFAASQATQCLTNAVLSVEVAAQANVQHVTLQEDAGNFHIETIRAAVARDGNYAHHHYALGASLARTDIQATLQGANAHVELSGLVFARQNQHLDVRTVIDHQVPSTTSDEEYRGIAADKGRVVFNGKVIVAKDAQKTDAKQSSRNLLLSPSAEIDTRPELEIYANDVKCAHGATVGQLDDTALFYLRSRGIDLASAKTLLTQAFAASILERTDLTPIRERVLQTIASRLHTGEAK